MQRTLDFAAGAGPPRLSGAAIVAPRRTSALAARGTAAGEVCLGHRRCRATDDWVNDEDQGGPDMVVMPRYLFKSVFRSDARYGFDLATSVEVTGAHKHTPPCPVLPITGKPRVSH
jgi:hypothetical protein